jgi:hypothetical protein
LCLRLKRLIAASYKAHGIAKLRQERLAPSRVVTGHQFGAIGDFAGCP